MTEGGNGKIICAICYEEAKPFCEELQSISHCGHVFHELCLQQWLEYCPPGQKSTCPLCKRRCSDKDVHRLYFQSSNEATQAVQANHSQLFSDNNSLETLQATVEKLTGQLLAAKSSNEVQQEQIREANKQELERSTAEQCKLLERNTLLTKEIASNNLSQKLDIDEDEVARIARVGCGNKDDVILTLTRSLVLRNRAYKDLMAKCNELGRGESRARHKYEKAFERVKALKAKMQQLERYLEDKENSALRFLRETSDVCHDDPKRSILSSTKPMLELAAAKPCLPLQPTFELPSEFVKKTNNSNIATDSFSLRKEETTEPSHPSQIGRFASEQKTVEDDQTDQRFSVGRTDVAKLSGVSNTIRIVETFEFTGTDAHHNGLGKTEVIADAELCADELSKPNFPVTIRREGRLPVSTVDETCRTTNLWNSPALNASKWCKQSCLSGKSSAGTFISVGADGRGGQVKILRPSPVLKVGEISSDNCPRPAKKMKSSRSSQPGNHCRSLQIEHFFSGS
ncbi:hypothetical protein KP509_27G003800 [Ceratopteris richardii]|uniref:RING-type domain-containing protein n=1 Tax=Ceratopteris richardii TaxID=49495 RepID=A0A8T2RDH9_CERRI|nr:hypothetical protein KP509_27G003800 [Ceratopteris richardii]